MYKNLLIARKFLFAKQIQSGFSVSQRVIPNFLPQNANGGVGRYPMSMTVVPADKEIVPDNSNGGQITDESFIRNYTTTSIEPPSTRTTPAIKEDCDTKSYEPVDIDPWADAENDEPKDTEIKDTEITEPKDIGAEFDFIGREYPPIPEKRAGEYKFKGIKVKLPPKFLGDGTYRYCLDKEDEGLADDIRVIRFEKR